MSITWNKNKRSSFDNFQLQYYSDELKEKFFMPRSLQKVFEQKSTNRRGLGGEDGFASKATCTGLLTASLFFNRGITFDRSNLPEPPENLNPDNEYVDDFSNLGDEVYICIERQNYGTVFEEMSMKSFSNHDAIMEQLNTLLPEFEYLPPIEKKYIGYYDKVTGKFIPTNGKKDPNAHYYVTSVDSGGVEGQIVTELIGKSPKEREQLIEKNTYPKIKWEKKGYGENDYVIEPGFPGGRKLVDSQYPVSCLGPIPKSIAQSLYADNLVLGVYSTSIECKKNCRSVFINLNLTINWSDKDSETLEIYLTMPYNPQNIDNFDFSNYLQQWLVRGSQGDDSVLDSVRNQNYNLRTGRQNIMSFFNIFKNIKERLSSQIKIDKVNLSQASLFSSNMKGTVDASVTMSEKKSPSISPSISPNHDELRT